MSNPGQAGLCPHNPLLVKVMPHTSCACCSRCDACRDNTGKRIWISKFSACQGNTILFLQASRSFTAPVSPRRYCRLVREKATLFPGRGIFILVCSFSWQGAVTASQIIPVTSFLFGVYFTRLLCYNGDNRNLCFVLSPS